MAARPRACSSTPTFPRWSTAERRAMRAWLIGIVAGLAAAASAWGQQEKTVDGLVIDLGIMSAEKAVHALGHADAHPKSFPGGSQHILIAVADAKTHQRIGDATVVVDVRSPNGQVE